MKKTFGILAHVDAGKTTFSEQLLYHTKSIKERGRVDNKNAFLDNHMIERERGITVFADQGMFNYNGSTYYLIDTPGHVDFSPEMERAIQVMDYAIIIVSAVEGIEGHTDTVWELLRKQQIPTFFFINKIDRIGANVEQVTDSLRKEFNVDIFELNELNSNGQLEHTAIEIIAERDEELLSYYLEQGYNQKLWINKLQELIKKRNLFPVASGSALQDIGIESFIEKFNLLTVTAYEENQTFSGRVFKIRYEDSNTRLTFIKALSGTLHVREELDYLKGDKEKFEKITGIRLYNGGNYTNVNQISAGDLFAVTGITEAMIGDGVGTLKKNTVLNLVPTLRSKVVFDKSVQAKEALKYFRRLEAEDPSLHVIWEEKRQEIQIHVMGKVQLEVMQQILLERFRLQVSFASPEIIYRETIDSTVVGYGHFEPLRHYAEVHLKLEPGLRNSGIVFDSQCHSDHLPIGVQNLIGQHVLEREHHGLLTGSSLTDIKVTLLTGRDHVKHTEGGDFREATYRAIRQGLEKAKSILLEPYYRFKIKVDLHLMGRVLSDIQTAHGKFNSPITEGDKAILTGTVPVATFKDYSTELAALTHGKGRVTLQFAGYDECHNTDEVINKINYNKDADPEYTSSSIFCAKGQGFSVPWDEVEKMMHCLK